MQKKDVRNTKRFKLISRFRRIQMRGELVKEEYEFGGELPPDTDQENQQE